MNDFSFNVCLLFTRSICLFTMNKAETFPTDDEDDEDDKTTTTMTADRSCYEI